ncbi:nitronate monooxygenase family protein [Nocardioides dubius]|uniref:Nitronate monooxygenase n=1 Tax=Nocardioides dubius TaxID=317019 RepID=A0ABN1TUU1_9ACTN
MPTEVSALCDWFGIDLPLFAFSHCRDVVAAVTNAGGFGVLGASSHTPQELEQELTWIDEQVHGRPYGVDIVVPHSLADGRSISRDELARQVPDAHKQFVRELLAERGVPAGPEELFVLDRVPDAATGEALLDVSFRHPIGLIANALGVPPPFMIERAKAAGVPVAALVGAKEHAVKQVQAGVDLLIAQGSEAGGHVGEVSTLVLVPEVIAAIRPIREVPVLAAGGIVTGRQMAAAVALGAAGAWTGSVWLTTEESETAPHTVRKLLAATSRDTVRSRSRTGKPCRQLRSGWTEAWDAADGPEALPMPLQSVLARRALARIDRLAETGNLGAQDLATYFVGQGVGLLNASRPVREVVREMAEDFLNAAERVRRSVAG